MRQLAIVMLLAACAEDTDRSTEFGPCLLDVRVTGGYTYANAGRATGVTCGASQSPTEHDLYVRAHDPDGTLHTVQILIAPPLAAGQTSEIAVDLVFRAEPDSATRFIWQSGDTPCLFDVTRNEELDGAFEGAHAVGGTIACPSALEPAVSNPMEAIVLEPFRFGCGVEY